MSGYLKTPDIEIVYYKPATRDGSVVGKSTCREDGKVQQTEDSQNEFWTEKGETDASGPSITQSSDTMSTDFATWLSDCVWEESWSRFRLHQDPASLE